jgi:hypothetical protein
MSKSIWAAAAVSLLCAASAHASVFPEAGYKEVYDLPIPTSLNFNFATIPYAVDNSASIANGSFSRVGYLLELQKRGGPAYWVSVSMDAFTPNASLIGVPTTSSGAVFNDTPVTNLRVMSNDPAVTPGVIATGGFIQFWPDDYLPGPTTYSTGTDIRQIGTHGYGSMQVGNGVGNTIFAYNAWNWNGLAPVNVATYGNMPADIGIGNQPTSYPDWTFSGNAGSYTVKELSVWVRGVPEPGVWALMAAGFASVGATLRRGRSRAQPA